MELFRKKLDQLPPDFRYVTPSSGQANEASKDTNNMSTMKMKPVLKWSDHETLDPQGQPTPTTSNGLVSR